MLIKAPITESSMKQINSHYTPMSQRLISIVMNGIPASRRFRSPDNVNKLHRASTFHDQLRDERHSGLSIPGAWRIPATAFVWRSSIQLRLSTIPPVSGVTLTTPPVGFSQQSSGNKEVSAMSP